MNFEVVSRSTIVFVIMVAMALSFSPVAWAEIQPDPTPSLSIGADSYNDLYYKDPARMVQPSPTPTPELLPPPYEYEASSTIYIAPPERSGDDSERIPRSERDSFYQEETPTPTPTSSPTPTPTATPTSSATPTVMSIPTPSATPTPTPSVTPAPSSTSTYRW